jgi:hypothetical protein
MATFALIHGGGGSASGLAPGLHLRRGERGHDAAAVDLPSENESAGWEEYTDAVVRAVGERRGAVVVGNSWSSLIDRGPEPFDPPFEVGLEAASVCPLPELFLVDDADAPEVAR